MLKLYISTRKKIKTKEIFKVLIPSGLDFQVSANYSYHKGKAERGYKITFFSLNKDEFKEKIWNPLSDLLNLRCAFMKYIDYMGCVRNWPGVFTESKCKACV
jgi:hypothetical protein